MVSFVFYFFSFLLIGSAFLVISFRNPVHAVLALIVAFFSAAGLFVILGAEFLAMLLMIVYVGAVAVLFLFVVMMLDIDFVELKRGLSRYLPLGLLIGSLVVFELSLIFSDWHPSKNIELNFQARAPQDVENTVALGQILYTDYVYAFQLAGLILFVAMIGAIVLTLRHKAGVKRQNVFDQVQRDAVKSIKLVDVKPGQGL